MRVMMGRIAFNPAANFVFGNNLNSTQNPFRQRLVFYDLFDGFVYGDDAKLLFNTVEEYQRKRKAAYQRALQDNNTLFRVQAASAKGRQKTAYLNMNDIAVGVANGSISRSELERVADVCLKNDEPSAMRNLNIVKAKIAKRYLPPNDTNYGTISKIAQLGFSAYLHA